MKPSLLPINLDEIFRDVRRFKHRVHGQVKDALRRGRDLENHRERLNTVAPGPIPGAGVKAAPVLFR